MPCKQCVPSLGGEILKESSRIQKNLDKTFQELSRNVQIERIGWVVDLLLLIDEVVVLWSFDQTKGKKIKESNWSTGRQAALTRFSDGHENIHIRQLYRLVIKV